MNKAVFSMCVLDSLQDKKNVLHTEQTVNLGVFRGHMCAEIRVITNTLILKLVVAAISHRPSKSTEGEGVSR